MSTQSYEEFFQPNEVYSALFVNQWIWLAMIGQLLLDPGAHYEGVALCDLVSSFERFAKAMRPPPENAPLCMCCDTFITDKKLLGAAGVLMQQGKGTCCWIVMCGPCFAKDPESAQARLFDTFAPKIGCKWMEIPIAPSGPLS